MFTKWYMQEYRCKVYFLGPWTVTAFPLVVKLNQPLIHLVHYYYVNINTLTATYVFQAYEMTDVHSLISSLNIYKFFQEKFPSVHLHTPISKWEFLLHFCHFNPTNRYYNNKCTQSVQWHIIKQRIFRSDRSQHLLVSSKFFSPTNALFY